jgi:hypothetical protein
MIERGMLDTIGTGLRGARDRLEIYIGRGNGVYLLAAVVVVVLFLTRGRRRR